MTAQPEQNDLLDFPIKTRGELDIAELDEAFRAYLPPEGMEDHGPSIEAQDRAEKHLRSLRYWEDRRQWAMDHAAAEMDQIQAWLENTIRPLDARISWHRRGLEAFCMNARKTMKLIGGTLKYVPGKERTIVPDPVAMLAWAKVEAPELVVAVPATEKLAGLPEIKKRIEAGLGVPEGVVIEAGPNTVKVELTQEATT